MKKIFFIIYILILNINFSEELVIQKDNKIGLVLSGGGAKGFAHIGLLKVLDKEKIPVDYIVGTSMGSIIGGLYSMGYTGEEIEKIILSRNWFDYFTDSISRENELMENKEDKDKYPLPLSLENWKMPIPKGAVKGQKADKLLEELYMNAKDITDFLKLPIPFACVATDAETGSPVVFTKGSLTDSIRASMSLPGLLDPVEIDGKMLLDGGLSNNFPVSVALDLGANYIIGQEVLGDLEKKEKLNNAIAIMNQVIAYKRVDVTDIEKTKVDLLINPDISKYNIFSFGNIKEIIDEGEKATYLKLDEIRKFRNEEKYNSIHEKRLKIIEEVEIESIEIVGSKNVSENNIKKMINLKLPAKLSIKDLNSIVDKLYSLRIFSKVNYKVIGKTLKFKVEDSTDKELKLGLNYNDSTKADIFAKFIKKDFYGNKSSVELSLGKDEQLKLENTWYIGPINKMGLSLKSNYLNIEDYTLMTKLEKSLNFNVNLINFDLMLGTFLSNKQIIGLGIKKELLEINSGDLDSKNEFENYETNYEILYFKYIYDSLDDKYFPKKGLYIEGLSNYYFKDDENKFKFSNYKLKINKPLKINNELSLNIGIEKNYANTENISPIYYPSIGGNYSRQNSVIFWGLNPSQYLSQNILSSSLELLYEWKPYRYGVLRINYANIEAKSNYEDEYLLGGGIGLGVKTPFGPIQLILSRSNEENIVTYLNIGYNF